MKTFIIIISALFITTSLRGQFESNPPSRDSQSQIHVIDWSEGSAWRTYVAKHGQPAPKRGTIRPPAFGRGDYVPVTAPPGTPPRAFELGEQDTELLRQIARGLSHDPLRIFNWVKTNVAYVPYLGLVQGAHVTALEMQGNDYDQCVLLSSLLKISGYEIVMYQEGTIEFTNAQLTEWLHWDPLFVVGAMNELGIQCTAITGGVSMGRVWLEVEVDGTKYLLDPAYKTSGRDSRLEVTDIFPSYDSDEITALAGGTDDSDDVYATTASGIDDMQNGLRNAMANYSINAARDQTSRDVMSILGLTRVNDSGVGSLDDGMVGTPTLKTSTPAIAPERARLLRIALGTAGIVYYWCDLGEDVLAIGYDSSSGGIASLYRNQDYVGTEGGFTPGQPLVISGGVVHPQAPGIEIPFVTKYIGDRAGRTGFAWEAYGTNGRLARTAKLQELSFNSDPSSEATMDYTLSLLCLRRTVHHENTSAIIGAITDKGLENSTGIWLSHIRGDSLVIDGAQISYEVPAIRPNSFEREKAIDSTHLWGSATESLTAEQITGRFAVSTINVYESALRNGKKVVRLTQDNWGSTIGEIEGGAAGLIPGVEEAVRVGDDWGYVPSALENPIYGDASLLGGGAYLVPDDDGWRYAGAYVIRGNFYGGGNQGGENAAPTAADQNKKQPETSTPAGVEIAESTDPVDLSNGAFHYQAAGLRLGDGSSPGGINYQHIYSSSLSTQNTAGVHWGWTHSYDLSVATSAATHIDLRRATVASLAPQIIMAQYLLDTASQLPTAKDIALRAAAAAGTARHLHDSVRLVSLGGRRIEFARLPDGSFMPTSSILATLTMAGDSSHALEFRHGNTISFRAEDGRATSIVDRYGQTMNLGYTDEKLTTVTDRFARGLTFAYLGDNLSTVTDSTGRVVSYALNGSSLTISGPDGYAMTFETDGAGHITRVLDAYARPIVENDYDAFGRVFQQRPLGDPAKQSELGYAPWTARETFADGFSDWTRFDPRYRRTSYEDGAGNVTRWSFDGWDRITSLTTPRDGVWEWGYDAYHVLTSEKDPVGQTRTIIPNSAHLPETIHDFKGNATIVTYTPQFRIDTITTAGGLLTDLDYDPTGLITALKPPAAEIATGFGNFDAHGNPQTITHPVGGTSSMTYNALGDVTQSIDRLQATTSFEYNNRRQLTATKRWFNQADPTSDAYDVQAVDLTAYANTGAVDFEVVGRLVRISDGSIIEEGLITNYVTDALDYVLEVQKGAALVPVLKNTYNDRNQLWQTHDANDALTEFGYDAAGRLIWSRDPRQNTTNYGYDADSNLTTTTTPLQSVFTSSFDLAGRLHTWTDALDRVVTYGRDPNGRTESLLNRRGKAYGWIYDDVNRVMTRSTPTGKTVTMTLNVRGLVESIVEASTQTTTFTEFDAEGRPTAMVDGVGNVTYNYWENGLPREITETVDGTPRTSLRIHDKLNRLHEYHDGEGNTLRYTYYPTDLLRSITYPDGTSQVTYVYDDFGRLHTVTDWAGRVTTYHWDNASRLMQVDRPNGTKRVMTYTVDNRLESINELGSNDSPIWQSEFTIIDEDGLIKQRSLVPLLSEAPLPVDAMVFDDDNRVSSFEALTVVHDDDGNMTSGPDQAGAPMTYVYDARNRLTMAGPMIYRYATDGQLAESNEGGVVSSYVVDPNTALSRTLVRTKNGQTTFYVYGLGLLYEDTAGATVTCHYDHMGSTVALSATDGVTLLDQLQYAAYGTIVGRTGAYDTPFLLHGETGVMTDTSGLNYMRARFYHPRMMRFINADPIEFSGGLNWYAAFGNNPMSLFDPWGFKDAPNSADERTIIEIPLATGMQRAAVEAEVLALRVALGAADIFGQIFGGEINQQWVDELVFRTRISQGVLPNSVGASVIDEGTDVAQIVGGAVLSGGKRPPSLSPHGAGRKGAFRQAKRDAGVPVGNQPSRVLPNINRQGKVVPGRVYEFDIPTEGGGTMTIRIRDDAAGHDFGVGDPQNRGPHFNGPVDAAGNSTHYDYP